MAVKELRRDERRTELSDFLRTRRARLTPEQVGLAPGVRRRTPGLRREELALLAGVGVTWYTWLEQGRRINPSAEVLGSLARTLRLDRAETDYLFRLATDPSAADRDPAPAELPIPLARLTTAQSPAPAFLMDADWQVRAWNPEADALFAFSRHSPADRNLAWLAFAHRPNRDRTVDWEQHARRLIAQLRATAGDRPALAATLDRLRTHFPEAARWLDEHQISERAGTAKDLAHETLGLLRIDQLVLQAPDGFQLVVFSPRDEETTGRLRGLAGA
ncbi:helix-turn-helix domain-containing protein [Kitasatospora sp. NPDC051853]|uniref:helix-turn-helix domain-containing protein n=1 Tax=Kitasatospora sp. NPDC051853 TaxID=3364058 RepID=UPI00379EE6BB